MYCISISSSDEIIFASLQSYRNAVLSKTNGNNIHFVLEYVGKVENLFKLFVSDKTDMRVLYEMNQYASLIDSETGVCLEIKE